MYSTQQLFAIKALLNEKVPSVEQYIETVVRRAESNLASATTRKSNKREPKINWEALDNAWATQYTEDYAPNGELPCQL